MSKLPQARSILQRLQQQLTDRLCDLLIDNEDALLDDNDWASKDAQTELCELSEKLRILSVAMGVLPQEKQGFQPSESVVVITAMPTVTLGDFLALINEGEYTRASLVLSHIFQIPEERAAQCTQHFVEHLRQDAATISKFMQLPNDVRTPGAGEMRLVALFGLMPHEAGTIVRNLTTSK